MAWDIFLAAGPVILKGVHLTLLITVLAFILGQLVALPLALAANARNPLLKWPAETYIFFIRGSPLLVQLFLLYYGLGALPWMRETILWPVLRDPLNCAILAVGLNSAAYMGALVKGALAQVPHGLHEAGVNLGLGRWQRLTRITLPLVYRQILPVLSSEMTLVLKASSLASTITVMEMTGAARKFVSQTWAPFEAFMMAGVGYLVIGLVMAMIFRLIERFVRIPGLGGKSA